MRLRVLNLFFINYKIYSKKYKLFYIFVFISLNLICENICEN